jgi:cell division septation protein DedD
MEPVLPDYHCVITPCKNSTPQGPPVQAHQELDAKKHSITKQLAITALEKSSSCPEETPVQVQSDSALLT